MNKYEYTHGASCTKKRVAWFLAGAFTATILFCVLSAFFDRTKPLISAENIRAGEFVEVWLPVSVDNKQQPLDSKRIAYDILQKLTKNRQSYYGIVEVVLTGKVQYVVDNEKMSTFFDEAYVTWLLKKDLLTIVIKSNEFINEPQNKKYRVFVQIPERGFTQDFHQAMIKIFEQIGYTSIKTKMPKVL